MIKIDYFGIYKFLSELIREMTIYYRCRFKYAYGTWFESELQASEQARSMQKRMQRRSAKIRWNIESFVEFWIEIEEVEIEFSGDRSVSGESEEYYGYHSVKGT